MRELNRSPFKRYGQQADARRAIVASRIPEILPRHFLLWQMHAKAK
jgi:hypothetical protein